jgi:hypothetical protein
VVVGLSDNEMLSDVVSDAVRERVSVADMLVELVDVRDAENDLVEVGEYVTLCEALSD